MRTLIRKRVSTECRATPGSRTFKTPSLSASCPIRSSLSTPGLASLPSMPPSGGARGGARGSAHVAATRGRGAPTFARGGRCPGAAASRRHARGRAPCGSICCPVATQPPEGARTVDEARSRWKGSARTYVGRGERIRTSDILLPNPRDEIAASGSGSQVSGDHSGFRDGVSNPLQPEAAIAKDFAPILLPVGRLPDCGGGLLAVGEVAKLLSVSDATIYALCARGILAHVRVLNAIRVAPAAVNALLTSPHRGVDGDDR